METKEEVSKVETKGDRLAHRHEKIAKLTRKIGKLLEGAEKDLGSPLNHKEVKAIFGSLV